MNYKVNKISQIIAAVALVAAVISISSCEKNLYSPPTINPVDTVHFQAEIQPIFNGKCITCHNGVRLPDLRDGKSYKSLTTGSFVDLPGETSILYTTMTGQNKPQGEDHTARSGDLDKQKVLTWINQGAHNN